MSDRIPPHNAEAEKAVLGGVIMAPALIAEVSDALAVDDFFLPTHREIFACMLALQKRGASVDVILLSEELARQGKESALPGGMTYLLTLANAIPTTDNLPHYIGLVRQKAALRKLIAACAEVMSTAYGDYGEFEAFVGEAEDKVFKVCSEARQGTDRPKALADLVGPAMEEFEKRAAAPGKVMGVPTGFMQLDYMISGLRPPYVHILAAETSIGKTALACQWALGAASHGWEVIFVTLEMSDVELVERFFAKETPIDNAKLRTGDLDYTDWKLRLTPVAARLSSFPMVISKARSLSRIEAEIKAVRMRKPGAKILVVIDYLQLVESPGAENRQLEVQSISRGLKRIGKDQHCAILALSQFRRGVEQGKPQLRDLRESGALEQDADVVMFIVRQRDSADFEIEVAKNRPGGLLGSCPGTYEGRYYRFLDAEAPPSRYGG